MVVLERAQLLEVLHAHLRQVPALVVAPQQRLLTLLVGGEYHAADLRIPLLVEINLGRRLILLH